MKGPGADTTRSGEVDPPERAGPGRARRELRAFGELLALSGLAIAQPVFDVFGRAPDHLLLRGADRGDVIVFALLITFAAPVTLWLVEMLVGLIAERARTVLHGTAIWVLVAIAVTLLTDTALTRPVALTAGALVATGFLLLHHRTRGPRIWLAFLSPAPIVFLAIFLFASPVAPILRGGGSTVDAAVGNPTRTMVVVFDELSLMQLVDGDGDVDADLFPNFARLADTSHWFRQATTVANSTNAAVPSMLTGDLPSGRPAATLSTYPDNLFTLIGDSLPTHAVETLTHLCPDSTCNRIDAPTNALPDLLRDARDLLRHRLDPTDPTTDPLTEALGDDSPDDTGDDADIADASGEAPGSDDLSDEDVDEALEALGDGGARRLDRVLDTMEDGPSLQFIHLLLPHGPFRFLPDGTVYRGSDALGRTFDVWLDDPTPVELVRQLNLLQLQYTDRLLGHLIDRLVDEDRWDDTNLIVLADHGIAFEPGAPSRVATAGHLDPDRDDRFLSSILWVPFFVKEAGQTDGIVSEAPVRIVDLLPTIADLLDIDIPWETDGRSVFDGGSGREDHVSFQVNTMTEATDEPGPDIGIDREEGWRWLLEHAVDTFAPGGDGFAGSDRVFRLGPAPDLLGRPVPEGAEAVEVDIADDSRADDVDPGSSHLPALFRATTDEASVGETVAIAVDGTVRATTRVYEDDGTNRIDAILPPDAFEPGRNPLTVHRLGTP